MWSASTLHGPVAPTSDVAGLRRAVLDSVGHPLTTNAEGTNQRLMHPGLSLQLSQEVYITAQISTSYKYPSEIQYYVKCAEGLHFSAFHSSVRSLNSYHCVRCAPTCDHAGQPRSHLP